MYSITIEGITLNGSCFDDVLTRVLNKVYTTYDDRDYKTCVFRMLKSDGTLDRRFVSGVGLLYWANGRFHFNDYMRPSERCHMAKLAYRFFGC